MTQKKKPVGLLALLCAFVTFTVVFSLLERRLVLPLEYKGAGLVIILVFYMVFRLVLGAIYSTRSRKPQ